MRLVILAKGVHDGGVVTFACADPEIDLSTATSIAFSKDSLDVEYEAEAVEIQEPAQGFRVVIRYGEQSSAFDVVDARLEHDGGTLVLQPEAEDFASMRTFIAACQAQQASQDSTDTATTEPTGLSPATVFGAPQGNHAGAAAAVAEQQYDAQGNPVPALDRQNAGLEPGEGESKEGGASPEGSAPASPGG